MAHKKAAITLLVGILSILSSVLIIIFMGLTKGFCNLEESCIYITNEPLWIFAIGLLAVGGLLTLIGFICDGAKDDDVSKQKGVEDGN